MILGCFESGRRVDGPLNHWTGRGWVRFRRGQYHDALYIKRNTVVCFIMETLGGDQSWQVRLLAHQTPGP